jgi:hypothetical protein
MEISDAVTRCIFKRVTSQTRMNAGEMGVSDAVTRTSLYMRVRASASAFAGARASRNPQLAKPRVTASLREENAVLVRVWEVTRLKMQRVTASPRGRPS